MAHGDEKMRKKVNRKIEGQKQSGNVPCIRLLILMCLLLLVAAGMLFGVYRCVNDIFTQSDLSDAEKLARQNLMMVQSFVRNSEQTLLDWANLVRDGGYTDSQDVLREISQGAQLLGSRRLYLVDTDFFYYGSDGIISQNVGYDDYLKTMDADIMTLRHGSGRNRSVLVCGKVKPFTVDTETFRYVLAEYEPAVYHQDMGRGLHCAEPFGILSGSGAFVISADGKVTDFSVWMEGVTADGYPSAEVLPMAMAEQEELTILCRRGEEAFLLVSQKMDVNDWILLTQYPENTQSALKDRILMLYLGMTVFLTAAAFGLLVLLFRVTKQGKRIAALETDKIQLEQTLETVTETNRSQTEFIDRISYDIRTPLNSIVGYTALIARHIREPELTGGYLQKMTRASDQLLFHLERGLGKPEAEPAREPVAEAEPVDLTGRRILLVEDNEMNREIACAILADTGLVTEYAVNGQEGFQKVATSKPGYYDLVLMDIQMPVMDGCEATRMIRRLRTKKLAEIPILAMTASVTDADKQAAFQSGMDGYVEKPINIDRLFSAIQSVLKRKIE